MTQLIDLGLDTYVGFLKKLAKVAKKHGTQLNLFHVTLRKLPEGEGGFSGHFTGGTREFQDAAIAIMVKHGVWVAGQCVATLVESTEGGTIQIANPQNIGLRL